MTDLDSTCSLPRSEVEPLLAPLRESVPRALASTDLTEAQRDVLRRFVTREAYARAVPKSWLGVEPDRCHARTLQVLARRGLLVDIGDRWSSKWRLTARARALVADEVEEVLRDLHYAARQHIEAQWPRVETEQVRSIHRLREAYRVARAEHEEG